MFTSVYDPEKAQNAISFLDEWSTIIADMVDFFKKFWEKISGLFAAEEE